ncbi:MAG: DNA-directed RNA polymerase subunit A' [Candidatus Aenigmatarchaeota archaeon]
MWRISAIEFRMLDPELIKNMAKVRIVTSELYDADGYPVEGGVMDLRLGVIDPGLYCRTCGGGMGDCLGHFGYLELAKPVIHVLYTKLIYDLLRITCRKCGRIIIENVAALSKTLPSKCPHCKAEQKKIRFVKPYTFYEDKDEMNPIQIRERFEKIPDGDLEKIGIKGGRPEWLILTLLPIPPVTVRPSITLETGERSEDDLTHKLADIVRINQSLKENMEIGAPEFIINDLWELVQYHTATYFDNELTGAPLARHRSGRPLKGIMQRLKAKEGRIRGNLLGKRVNFSSRTVISPDPKLSINEVGVPEKVAKELTIPVYVTALNLKEAKEMIKAGKVNYVQRPDGRRIKVTSENIKDIIEGLGIGWQIERQLQDGDVVLFNRQPSLHRISMMAHRVRVMPYQTFRLNPSVCPPYNADFDGDEMNLHALQTEEARAEARLLLEVQNHIISPKFGGPIIGLDLDQISGSFLLTSKDTSLTREEASQLLAIAGIDVHLPNKNTFEGKEIFSLLLPESLNIEFEPGYAKGLKLSREEKIKNDAIVIIKNGKLVCGQLDKTALGVEKGLLISELRYHLNNEQLKDFIDKAGKLGAAFLKMRGFSIGLSDLDVKQSAINKIKEEIEQAENDSMKFIRKFHQKELPLLPGLSYKESLETHILNRLSNCLSKVSEIVSQAIPQNDLVIMAKSGAKGSMINITQMAAVVGQETILGKRITRGYMQRTLTHFKPGDLSPIAHGFVASGFKQGLNPFEIFWNIMNGREGLMDKSLRTRKSGYMQRRLVNALQDLRVTYDGTVRTATGAIVQFLAGEDGIDPSKSHWGELKWRVGF